jgi:hypothetical protein
VPTWLTLAHEMGHILGASHSFEAGVGTTGGIMDYSNGMLRGTSVYGFEARKRSEVCRALGAAAQRQCGAFLVASSNAGSGCGDKFLDPSRGEQCECVDGTTSCEGCVECRLVNAAQQCSATTFFMDVQGQAAADMRGGTLSSAQCCSSKGVLAMAGTKCSAGLCSLGQCLDPCSMSASPLRMCASPVNSGCRAQCALPGANTLCSPVYWTGSAFAGDLANGTGCVTSDGGAGRCSAGVCTASNT